MACLGSTSLPCPLRARRGHPGFACAHVAGFLIMPSRQSQGPGQSTEPPRIFIIRVSFSLLITLANEKLESRGLGLFIET